jgi:hypothetical protein
MNDEKPAGYYLCAVCGKSGPAHGHYNARDSSTHKFVAGQFVPAAAPKFVAVGPAVLQGARTIARAVSKTMAKRIANALNKHTPNREGV